MQEIPAEEVEIAASAYRRSCNGRVQPQKFATEVVESEVHLVGESMMEERTVASAYGKGRITAWGYGICDRRFFKEENGMEEE